jgi:hypothetical protein
VGLVILSKAQSRRSRLAAERTRRCRQRQRDGKICFTSELDCRGLAWLVRIKAISEEDADNPNPKLVAKAIGEAVTQLIRISALADL